MFGCNDDVVEPEAKPLVYYYPGNGSLVGGSEVELIWCDCGVSSSSGEGDRFSVYIGTSPSDLVFYGGTGLNDTTTVITDLEPYQVTYWQVAGDDLEGGSYLGPIWSFEVATPIVYISPDNASTVAGPDVELIWHTSGPPEFSPYYDVYTGSSPDNLELYDALYDTSVTLTDLEPLDVAYWKVESTNEEATSYAGPLWYFRVSQPIEYISPDSAADMPYAGNDYEFIWHSLQSEDITYIVSLGFFQDELVEFERTPDTTFTQGVILHPPDTLFWKVDAEHEDEIIYYGPLWFFTVSIPEGQELDYVSPDSGSTVPGPDEELIWHASTGGSGQFEYTVNTGTAPNDLGPPVITTDTTYLITVPESLDTLYWKVDAFDGDATRYFGQIWFFEIDHADVEIPQNSVPDSGAVSVSVEADLSWEYTGTPEDVLYCDVYFGTAQDPPLVSDNQTATTYDPGTLDYARDYYWKVVAFTSETDSTVGPIWSFTTEEDLEIPQNPDPADGATSVSVVTNLSWDYSGTPSDVIYCDVYLGSSPDPGLVSANLNATLYDPPGDLEYESSYYWKIVAFTSSADSVVGPVWTFETETSGGQDIYAQFKLTADIIYDYFSNDVITARFDSSYAPEGPIDTLQADSVTVNGNLMYWYSGLGIYSYQEDPSLHWLVDGGTYTFDVYGNEQVPDLTLETTWLECSPLITYPTGADTIYNTGFTTLWEGTCSGTVVLTFVIGIDTADVRIETDNDGEYAFTEADLAPLEGYAGVISEVIILRESYYINEPGYQSQSEVIMWSTHTVTTIIE